MIRDRVIKEIIERAKEYGWEYVKMTKSGHHQLRHKNGAIYILGNTPKTNGRVMQNAIADLRRIAANGDGKKKETAT